MTGFGGMCLVLAIIFHSEALHDEVTLVERHRSTLIRFALLHTL
jgi:hypothetical protein